MSPARPGAQRTLSDKFYLQVSTTNIHAAGISCCLSWTWVCPGLQSGPGSHRQCSVSPARPGAQRTLSDKFYLQVVSARSPVSGLYIIQSRGLRLHIGWRKPEGHLAHCLLGARGLHPVQGQEWSMPDPSQSFPPQSCLCWTCLWL